MTPHYCPVEKTNIAFDDECNWCGMKESPHVEVISDNLAWITWALVAAVLCGLMVVVSYVVGKLI